MTFILLDKVTEFIPGEMARGIKNITLSEDVFHDHFPGHPVMPGTLILEAMAQLGGFLAESTAPKGEDPPRRAVLTQVDRAKFHAPCCPGDRLDLECRLVSALEGAARVEGNARMGNTQAASAEMTFVLRKIDSEEVQRQRRELYRIWTRQLHGGADIR
jgi:3-hydroxyacyl-[acyl-carrier-protein] dehydratase